MEDATHASPGQRPHRHDHNNEDLLEELNNLLRISDEERDLQYHIVPFRPLVDFIKLHIKYITPDSFSSENGCPIRLESPADSHERIVQIDLPLCNHVFGADCFEKYIQRSHTCPMCREMWFAKRITAEFPFYVRISVTDNTTAGLLRAALETHGTGLLEQILAERGLLMSDIEEDTHSEGSSFGEEEYRMAEGVSNYSLLADTDVVTTVESVASEVMAEPMGDVSGIRRQDVLVSMEISDEEVRAGTFNWVGDTHRSASDDEALAPPRQRRRYE